MKKRFLLIAFMLSLMFHTNGQTPFYTQQNPTRLNQNAAFTGLGHSTWRLAAIYQQAPLENAYTHSTFSGSFDYRIDPTWRHSDYGQIIERKQRYSFGLGLLSEVRQGSPEHHPYEGWYASAAFHYKPKNDFLFSMGIQPGLFMPSSWFPFSKLSFSSADDSLVLPGRAAIRKFDYNAGILIGYGNIDCWLEDLPKRFVAGIALRHAKREKRTEVIPGREVYIHASMLLESSRQWGIVPQAALFFEGSTHFSTGFQFLYRRHFGIADRFRFAFNYKSTGYISGEAGFRLYGTKNQTIGIDVGLSYDYAIKSKSITQPWPQSVIELGIVISPLKKCWGNNQCSGDFQLDRL